MGTTIHAWLKLVFDRMPEPLVNMGSLPGESADRVLCGVVPPLPKTNKTKASLRSQSLVRSRSPCYECLRSQPVEATQEARLNTRLRSQPEEATQEANVINPERESLYYWGIDGHDLTSIHADQSEHYHTVMTSIAGPAASLDLKDHFRGPADTTLENIPEAVLYESDPEERIDLTWVDEAFGEYTAESYDETFCLAKEPPTFEEVAESFLTEPKVTFVTDAQGKTVPR